MASEQEAKSAEILNEGKNEEMNERDETLCNKQESTQDEEAINELKHETKDDNHSENESETFEDAVEEMDEKFSNVNTTDSTLDEDKDKNGEHSDDEDSYLEPSTPLTDEEKLVGWDFYSWFRMVFPCSILPYNIKLSYLLFTGFKSF